MGGLSGPKVHHVNLKQRVTFLQRVKFYSAWLGAPWESKLPWTGAGKTMNPTAPAGMFPQLGPLTNVEFLKSILL